MAMLMPAPLREVKPCSCTYQEGGENEDLTDRLPQKEECGLPLNQVQGVKQGRDVESHP
jgi:hypothetical protein